MPSLVITDDPRVITFRGKGLIGSDPDASNIVEFNANVALSTQDVSPDLSIPDTRLSIRVAAPYQVTQIGIQGTVSGDYELVAEKTERTDMEEDTPNPGDITVYLGKAAIGASESDPVWLITKQVFIKDGNLFDGSKKYASSGENKKWTDRLSHPYT